MEVIDENQGNTVLIEEKEVAALKIHPPTSIVDFGLSQEEQLNILETIQDTVLQEQADLLNDRPKECPQCGASVNKNGFEPSNFHHIYSDHRVLLQKWVCSSRKDCAWSANPSVQSKLGSSLHGDLIRIQASSGARMSFGKSETHLQETLGEERPINNHSRISNSVKRIGDFTQKRNHDPISPAGEPAKELVVQVDGGFIHDREKKGNFEVMAAKVYQPANVVEISKDRNEIVSKNCSASSKQDGQETMMELTIAAAIQQGMTEQTKVVALCDGAKNCWNIIEFFQGCCAVILCILDWFHIDKKLTTLFGKLSNSLKESKELIRECLWRGNADMALSILERLVEQVKSGIHDAQIPEEIQEFSAYIENNKNKIVNYQERKEKGEIYTSSVIESTVGHLIKERCGKKQRMRWTRDKSHALLQIRVAMASHQWETIWKDIEEKEFLPKAG